MYFVKDEITANFKFSEFACDEKLFSSATFIRFVFLVLQPFREWYKRPININGYGGYRDVAINAQVGGDYNSLHLVAQAIDFNLPVAFSGYSSSRKSEFLANVKEKWFSLCRSAGGFGQMTVHDGWVHMGFSLHREYYDDRRKYK